MVFGIANLLKNSNDDYFDGGSRNMKQLIIRKCLLRGHILAPLEGLHAPELPGVNPGEGGHPKSIFIITEA